MARILNTTVSADGDTTITLKPARKETNNRFTISVFGGGGNNFGSGTVTLKYSPDGGTTYIDLTDSTGATITFTADKVINLELYGNQDIESGEICKLRLSLSGSTSPTVRYVIDDIR